MMDKGISILHLEDDPDFAELVKALLAQDGVRAEIKRVCDREAFELALNLELFDVILSDFHLPSFTGLDALELVKQKTPNTPFILISGTIGEQAAIEGLRAGATDYILKQQPERLPSAVRRAVKEAEERRARLHGETELIRREKYFRALTENSLDVLSVLTKEGVVIYKSASVKKVLGYEPDELIGRSVFDHVHPEDLLLAQKAFQTGLAEPERTVMLQFRYRHKDGSWRHLEAMGQNRLADPQIHAIVVNSRDVSDRLRAEENLRESEKHYRLLFQSNPNPMWVFDLETLSFLEVNEAALQQYGYSREEFLRMKVTDLQASLSDEPGSLIASEDHRVRIWKHRRKNGSTLEVEVIWSPMAFRGRFAALTLATNLTERLRMEHRNLVFSKLGHGLSSAATASEAAKIICEMADALFKWEGFAIDLYSTERDEIFSLLNVATIDGERVELPQSIQSQTNTSVVKRVIQHGAELFEPDQTAVNSATVMLSPIRKGNRVIGVLFIQGRTAGAYSHHDLETLQTLADHCGGALERLRVEEALRENQQRFQDLFENSPDAIFVEDLDGNVLDVNPTACALHGLKRHELIGKNVIDLVPPDRREQAQGDFQKLVSGELSRVEGESRRFDGRAVPVEVRASRIQYNKLAAVLLHVRDITDRRAAETALRSSEILFRSVWENSVDGMRLTDEQGNIVAANNAFCRLVGMDIQDLEGKPFTIVYADIEQQEKKLERHHQIFQEHIAEHKSEYQVTLHNGRTAILEIAGSLVELHGRPLLSLDLFRDVTAQRQLEERLRQSQKMEAIGQLAGGVAHDFNNILTVIQGHATMLLSGGDLPEMARKSAEQIAQAADRAAGLTRQLLAFSRRQLLQPRRHDMNQIVGNMTNMLGRLLGENIALQLNYCQAAPIVEADGSMMEQILLNLAVNARDAMPKGGQLTIRIACEYIDEKYVQNHAEARVGEFVCLSVGDTGHGISPENLQRIFEPFFTTKEIGRGTGLGLATVYGIIKQHQGWIEVESELNKGTTFRVYLPQAKSQHETEMKKQTTKIAVRGGNETILLVEDEEPVCELVSRVLRKYGYKVLTAGTGVEAVKTWERHKDEIALLLTDLVMPDHMNGRELAEKLCAEQPSLKVVFTSGYSADIVGRDFKLEPEVNFLQKPYHPQILAITVRKCLDKATH